ncbi:Engulfment and cell motility protein 3 [Ophiophagus hannah]|uniref:Engulfment and cell motility protein 3 n=1 Tax=Ophiophagus hannah TaxID=8665 RepID=V8NNZ6_OPHHA|nr:Engulfment and cell motility protein 3 [Ophiophagus hannah]
MPPSKDVVKIAVQMMGAIPQLIELNQYVDGQQAYITELNRGEIKNGSILQLTTAPDQEAAKLHGGIQSNSVDVKTNSLKKLASLSRDVAFAQEFISRNGLNQLFSIVEEDNNTGEILAYTLKAFVELMEHDFVSWETLSPTFIKKIVSYINISPLDASIQQISLAILENMVPTSRALFELVKQQVTLDRLIALLQVMNTQLQLKAMALLIALLLNAGEAERRDMMNYLGEKNLRQFIHKNIVHASDPIADEMAHYLYVLQSLTLNLLERRMRAPMDPYSQEQRDLLQSLRHAAFVSENESSAGGYNTERRHSLCAKEFRKLGFVNNSNPALDLHRTPPGLLALDSMVYFSRHYPNIYSRRLLHLCEGTLFRKISSRRRQDKLWYCRLSPNHKFLHYGDVEEGVENPPIESLQEKVSVADMKALLVGRECPHTKEKSSGKQNKDLLDLAFSISYDFCLWTDGLNVLLGREMVSERMQTDLDILLSMELKLRLLDLENITIPDAPPDIPKPPSNLNFCYDFTHIEQHPSSI